MNTAADQSPEVLEQEVNERRANLNQTLNAVEQKLSPNHLMEQTLDYFGQHGGDIAHSVSRSIKDNPLPLLLTGVGLAWLMSSQSRGSAGQYEGRYDAHRERLTRWDEGGYQSGSQHSAYARTNLPVNDRSDDVQSQYNADVHGFANNDEQGTAESLRTSVRDTAEQWSHNAERWKEELGNKLSSMKQEAEESAEDWQKRVIETSLEHSQTVQHRMQHATDQLQTQARHQANNARQLMTEQPLVMGALGIAAGALIGTLLPSTRVENRMIGDQAKAVKDSIGERADELKSTVTEKAGHVAQQASKTVSEQAERLREKGEAAVESVDD